MDSRTLQEQAKKVALELPFTEHCWPFGPEYDVFKVGGKIFMLMGVARGRAHVSLKADPEKSLLNQAIYRSLEPGYHLNKNTGSPSMPAMISPLSWLPIWCWIPGIWWWINCPNVTRSVFALSDCSPQANSLSAFNALIISRFPW